MVTRRRLASASDFPRDPDADIVLPQVIVPGATAVRAALDARQHGIRP
jgi:hypothetical protein